MEDKERAIEFQFAIRKSLPSPCSEIATAWIDPDVVMRVDVTEILNSSMAKIYEKSKNAFIQTVAETFEDALQPSFLSLIEGVMSALLKIVEQSLKRVILACQCSALDKFLSDHVILPECMVGRIVK